MADGILGAIANPQVANIGGQFQQGQLGAQQLLTGGLQQTALLGQIGAQRQAQGQQQRLGGLLQSAAAREPEALQNLAGADPAKAEAMRKLMQGMDADRTQAMALDLVGASLAPDDKKNALLNQALQKASPQSPFHQAIQSLINMPPGEEKDAGILLGVSSMRDLGFVPGGQKAVPSQKTGAHVVRKADGTTEIVVGVFNPNDESLSIAGAEIPGAQLVSKLGETAAEATARRIGEAGGKRAAEGTEARITALIDRGTTAAESTAVIRRGLDLLEKVKTGGVAAISLAVKSRLGIEGADEGELSNSLGKAVLSQLRETFGAAFTENEGKRLERIEAAFGKSPETNRRLLTQALRVAENTAKRARKAALKRKDRDTVDDITDLLSFSLALDEPQQAEPVGVGAGGAPQAEQTATNPQTGQKIAFRNGQWVDAQTGAQL